MYWLPYDKNLKEFSRRLRKNSTLGEILLWQKLRAGNMMNYTFNRQKPLGRYIVDFYCKPLRLVIEIDGSYHFEAEQKVKDDDRQKLLEKMGLYFLRFSEQQIRKDMDIILKEIGNYITEFDRGLLFRSKMFQSVSNMLSKIVTVSDTTDDDSRNTTDKKIVLSIL